LAVKALALRTSAVLIGRPYLWGLALGGGEGALRVLELLRNELATDLLLCGLASVQAVRRGLIVPAGPLGGG
jgi:isopentenyl diphosphate isomerase/L-lactate dehydrogenase-like FMN-dependent dehydrogenase